MSEKSSLFQMIVSSILSNENILLLSPRGAGKSYFVKEIVATIKGLTPVLPVLVQFSYNEEFCRTIRQIVYDKIIESVYKIYGYVSYFVKKPLKDFLTNGNKDAYRRVVEQVEKEYSTKIMLIGEDFPGIQSCLNYIDLFSISTSSIPIVGKWNSIKVFTLRPCQKTLMHILDRKKISASESALRVMWEKIGFLPRYLSLLLPFLEVEARKGLPIDSVFMERLLGMEDLKMAIENIAKVHNYFYIKHFGRCYMDVLKLIAKRGVFEGKSNNWICFDNLEKIGLITKENGKIDILDKPILTFYK